ncbi:hypothetical protein J41TS12_39280 [Paenibacillus antibioticophila]|uniref:Uncharacterized protein n=1 Tax=Paenibacillus antibioticophila TaxID=1274374 RepID=A0A919XYR4_9BACL|nr:hypothetical protein [Paenibacillus antibioticophila]GIO39067.1 hypothetical protein J41TS12_39280 [Paenibacillus antibioticophila]
MSLKVKKNHNVLVEDRTYRAGEIIPSLDEKEEKRLLNLDVCELAPDLPSSIQGTGKDKDSNNGDQLPPDEVILTIEQFAELKADEQKARLKKLEIEPEGKAEDRIAQYEDWYAQQLPAGDLNAQL